METNKEQMSAAFKAWYLENRNSLSVYPESIARAAWQAALAQRVVSEAVPIGTIKEGRFSNRFEWASDEIASDSSLIGASVYTTSPAAPYGWIIETGHGAKFSRTKPNCEVDLWKPVSLLNAPPAAPVTSFPQRDVTKSAEQQGLFEKFRVQRLDGSDCGGGKHYGCKYFVLDLDHDQHAPAAMQAYAASCRETHPQLTADIDKQYPPAAPVALSDATDNEQAEAWMAVVAALDKHMPGWISGPHSGLDSAVMAIDKLFAERGHVSDLKILQAANEHLTTADYIWTADADQLYAFARAILAAATQPTDADKRYNWLRDYQKDIGMELLAAIEQGGVVMDTAIDTAIAASAKEAK